LESIKEATKPCAVPFLCDHLVIFTLRPDPKFCNLWT